VDIKRICGYLHNGYSHRYGYKYKADIYSTDRVWRSYYLYPTCPVDIPIHTTIVVLVQTIQSLFQFENMIRIEVIFKARRL